MKSKQELIEEVKKIAIAHNQKKEAIEKMLNDLDKEKISPKHIQGMSVINDMLKEMSDLESQYNQIKEQIKGN